MGVECNVTGGLTPDATCNYVRFGEYGGKPYYRREDGLWFIWWDEGVSWVISQEVGSTVGPYWEYVNPLPWGYYYPWGGAIGNALVLPGTH